MASPRGKASTTFPDEITVRRRRVAAKAKDEGVVVQTTLLPSEHDEYRAFLRGNGGLVGTDFVRWAVMDAVRSGRVPPEPKE